MWPTRGIGSGLVHGTEARYGPRPIRKKPRSKKVAHTTPVDCSLKARRKAEIRIEAVGKHNLKIPEGSAAGRFHCQSDSTAGGLALVDRLLLYNWAGLSLLRHLVSC